jgi:hypothetical protein
LGEKKIKLLNKMKKNALAAQVKGPKMTEEVAQTIRALMMRPDEVKLK